MSTVILGLDPGLAHLGWGVISAAGADLRWIGHGALHTERRKGMAVGRELAVRVDELSRGVALLLDIYRPTEAALEEFRFYGKGVTSALQVANVVGMLRESLRARGIHAAEYSAQEIKLAVAGGRNAEKRAVQAAVQERLGLRKVPRPEHAADALGAAITHAARLGAAVAGGVR